MKDPLNLFEKHVGHCITSSFHDRESAVYPINSDQNAGEVCFAYCLKDHSCQSFQILHGFQGRVQCQIQGFKASDVGVSFGVCREGDYYERRFGLSFFFVFFLFVFYFFLLCFLYFFGCAICCFFFFFK